MDKFGRKPKAKERWRKLALYVVAFLVPATCFAVLFGFRNTGAKWVIAFYCACLIVAFVGVMIAGYRRWRLWTLGLRLQPDPRPGFTTLEVAAINDLIEHAGWEGDAIRRHFAISDAVLRYNSGSGCVTTVASDRPNSIPPPVLDHVFWVELDGLRILAGCKFWAQDGSIDLIEIFCGGEDTRQIDWTRISFVPDRGLKQRPPIPSVRPIITEPGWIRFRPEA